MWPATCARSEGWPDEGARGHIQDAHRIGREARLIELEGHTPQLDGLGLDDAAMCIDSHSGRGVRALIVFIIDPIAIGVLEGTGHLFDHFPHHFAHFGLALHVHDLALDTAQGDLETGQHAAAAMTAFVRVIDVARIDPKANAIREQRLVTMPMPRIRDEGDTIAAIGIKVVVTPPIPASTKGVKRPA